MKLNGYQGTILPRSGMIYENGITDYCILIPEHASEAEKYAAEELTRIMHLANVNIPIVTDANLKVDPDFKCISLGNTVYFQSLGLNLLASEFKFDGFIIESFDEAYIVKGVGDTGTCFGVYGFAEYAMGYRYYTHDEQKIETNAPNLTFHIKDIPTFLSRVALSNYTSNYFHINSTRFTDHAFRLRVNGQFSDRKTKHGEGTPWSTLHDQSLALQIIDYTKYRAEHPDWFYLHPGGDDEPAPRCYPQLCFSKAMLPNSEGGFFDLFMDHLINDYIIPESNKMFFMLGISDNIDFCQCPLCQEAVKKYKQSGLNMRFVNKVADAVEAWRKENAPERVIWIITFAYLSSFEAPVIWQDGKAIPVDPSVIARDNVMVRFAPIRANYCYDLLDEKHNLNSRNALLGWSSIAKHLSVWDYRSDFGTHSFPFPSSITAQANHDIYCRFGIIDVLNQAQPFTDGSPFLQMDDFARAKMHWNGKETYDELTDEFRKAFYKESEPWVTEYLHFLENECYPLWLERGWNGQIGRRASLMKSIYRVSEMYEHKKILDKALSAAESQLVYDRVNALTLFYKLVLVLCFPLEIPKDEALQLISELRVLSKTSGFKVFVRKTSYTDNWLDEAEAIVHGKITEEERTLKLQPV